DVGQYNAPAYKSILIGSKYVPYLRFKDSEGAPLPVDQRYRGIYTDTAGAGKLQDWKFYPLDDYTHYHYNTIRQDYLSQIAFSYRMLKNLQITLNYQRKQQISESPQLIDVGGIETRKKINLFTQWGKTAADPF